MSPIKWPVLELEKLADLIDYGLTTSATIERKGPKFLRITDIQNGGVDWASVPYCECSKEDAKRYTLASGDIVFARTGATTGKSFLIRYCPEGSVFASYLIRVRPNSSIDPGYLFRFFQTSDYWQQISKRSTGTAQAGVNASSLKGLLVPLPSFPEQRRIAAILDKADSLREKRRQAITKLDELLKSVFIEMFGDPVTNPKGWERRSLDEVVENIDSGWSPVCLDRPAEDREWGVLKLGAVTSCKYLEFENKALPEGLESDSSLEVKPGDLLFSRKNTYDLVAACAFVLSTRPKLMLSDLIFRFRLKNDCGFVPEFLWALLTHPGKRKQVQTLASGSAGSMPNISKSRLLKFLVERPPSELQQDFALRMRAIQRLSEDFIKSSRLLDNNFNSLQQRTFSGELFTEKTVSPLLLTEVAQHV